VKFAIEYQAVISEVLLIYGRHYLGWFQWWHFLPKVQRLWSGQHAYKFSLTLEHHVHIHYKITSTSQEVKKPPHTHRNG